jgi:hypothetical protein
LRRDRRAASKWDERPLLIIQSKDDDAPPPKEELLEMLGEHFAKVAVAG